MKCISAMIAVLTMGAESIPAFAEFHSVRSKFCDRMEVPVRDGERVFVDLSNGVLGIGFTKGGCRVVDFNSVVTQQAQEDVTIVAVAAPVGRRSSCSSGISRYAGPNYSIAVHKPGSLTIQNVEGDCSEIVFLY